MKKIPFGIKFARAVNFVYIAISFLIVVLLLMIAIPNYMRAAEQAGAQVSKLIILIMGLVALAIWSLPAFIFIKLNDGLKNLSEKARVWQIVVSCLSLVGFPVWTVMSAIVLYFMLFDKATKEAFHSISDSSS